MKLEESRNEIYYFISITIFSSQKEEHDPPSKANEQHLNMVLNSGDQFSCMKM